jgi:hypothetical protein
MSYKLIHETFWTDPKVKELSVKNKLLFLYCITNPHSHYSGIYYLPTSVIKEETGLSKKEIRYGIDTLSERYLVKYDPQISCIWVVKMLKFQAQGEKQLKGIENHLKTLHNSSLIKDFLDYYAELQIPYQYPINTVSGMYHTVNSKQKTEYNSLLMSSKERTVISRDDKTVTGSVTDVTKSDITESKKTKKSDINKNRIDKNIIDKKRIDKNRNILSDSDFINVLKENPAYKGIDIDRELAKMDAWLLTPAGKRRKKTRRFIVNWLNRIDKPLEEEEQDDGLLKDFND